jgi:hypothetical protein
MYGFLAISSIFALMGLCLRDHYHHCRDSTRTSNLQTKITDYFKIRSLKPINSNITIAEFELV